MYDLESKMNLTRKYCITLSMLLWTLVNGNSKSPLSNHDTREKSVPLDIPGIGTLVGQLESTSLLDMPVYEFLGIPYATKPERFKAPTSYAQWTEPLDATRHSAACPELELPLPISEYFTEALFPNVLKAAAVRKRNTPPRETSDPEDCLTLDIYTPSVDDANLPVFFYIHGGAFVFGSSSMASGGYLLEHGKIVLVSVQYRLGPMGFLAAEEADAPGNAALHDLSWALRWVKDHIRHFGGNPDHIVVGGVSAGAALSGLLSVSPQTREMVVGSALFSGSALSPWTVDADPWRSARGVGVFARCLDPETLADCLRRRSSGELNTAWAIWTVYEKYFRNHGMGGVIPSVNPDDSVLPRHPLAEILSSDFKGKPMLIGVTKHEGTFLLTQLDLFYMKARDLVNDERTLIHEIGDLLMQFADVDDNLNILGDAVKRLYFSEDTIGNYSAMFEGLVDFTGAGFFKGPAQRMARLNANAGGSSYLFSFDYARENAETSALLGGSPSTVHHGSDQYFLFPSAFDYTENDHEVINTYCKLVTEFVINLKPQVRNLEWRPHTLVDDYYISIDLHPKESVGFSDEFYVMERERREEDTSTLGPDTTTLGPDTSTLGPDTTTLGPDTTTLGPDTTTCDQDLSTLGQDTTTLSPGCSSVGPDVTTTMGVDTTPDTAMTTSISIVLMVVSLSAPLVIKSRFII